MNGSNENGEVANNDGEDNIEDDGNGDGAHDP